MLQNHAVANKMVVQIIFVAKPRSDIKMKVTNYAADSNIVVQLLITEIDGTHSHPPSCHQIILDTIIN